MLIQGVPSLLFRSDKINFLPFLKYRFITLLLDFADFIRNTLFLSNDVSHVNEIDSSFIT